ncbi:MAG: hypothetical protein HYY41_00870 [Chloroflexi bacterium]|nr:hypothetical protein [Chloroflexota bacterium]
MDLSLLILLVMMLMAIVIAFWKGRWQLLISGFKRAAFTLKTMWLRILLGMVLGGLIQVLVPTALIAEWLGPASGLKGILIGSYAGIIVVGGGPYVTLPILLSLYRAGAGVGPIIALLASVNLLSMQGLFVWQIPFLGTKLSLTRYFISLFIPPLIGLAGGAIYQILVSV